MSNLIETKIFEPYILKFYLKIDNRKIWDYEIEEREKKFHLSKKFSFWKIFSFWNKAPEIDFILFLKILKKCSIFQKNTNFFWWRNKSKVFNFNKNQILFINSTNSVSRIELNKSEFPIIQFETLSTSICQNLWEIWSVYWFLSFHL